ncbi:MAG: hypothetical protein HON32_08795 [Francisellaceae bacterium]|jgi:ABC-type transport system involved in Fe-S cluster assembly fused permease/ATPase subunit|nr:hypothetical protein [Francisellaceae bacterium]
MKVSKGIITIVIAHRLSTIQHADNIIVLDIVHTAKQCPYDEIMKKNSSY